MESSDSRSRLDALVESLIQKKKKYLLLKGSSIFALTIFICLGLASLLSLLYSNPIYYTLLKIITVMSLILIVIKALVIPLLREAGTKGVLGELDNIAPGLGEDTLNAIELKDNNIHNSRILGTSQNLALAHIDKIINKLDVLDLKSFYPIRNLKRYLILLIGIAIFASLITIFIPGNFPSYLLSFHVTPPNTGSHLELADIEITLKYPEYINLPTQKIKGTRGDVKAIKGTEIIFEAEPLNSFEKGSLIVENGISVPVSMSDGRIKAGFTVLGSGSFTIKETSTGLISETYRINTEEDKEPSISIRRPMGETVELGSEEKIDIFYEAEDDFGISKLVLTWENERGQSHIPIAKKEQETSAIKDKLSWGPSGINPGDGDTIKLRVLVYDNDTISGPKVGVSNAITIKLKDARSKHKETLIYAEQLMEELIDILGDEINIANERNPARSMESTGNFKSEPGMIDIRQVLKIQKKLTQKIEHAIGTLDITIAGMKEDEYSDFTYFVGLSNMELRIKTLLDERKYLIESFAKLDIGRLGRLMKREINEFEDDILLLDSMLKGDKLMDSLRSSKDLLNEYDELSELLKQLNEGSNEQLEALIQEKLNQIRDLMSQLAKKINGLDGDIQEGFLNQDAFEATNLQTQLNQISKLAREGDIDQALEMLSSLTQSLQNMMASLENGMQSFGSSMMAKEISKLNELISRIEDIEKEETSLKDKTGELKKDLLENPNSPRDNLREFIENEKIKVQELINNLKQARAKIANESPGEANPEGAYLVEKMIEKSEQLNNWLKDMNYIEASKNAKSIEESTKGLNEMSSLNIGNLAKASQEIGRAKHLAQEIRKDLERFNIKGNSENQFGKMAGRQDEIQGQTGDLSSEIGERGDGLFFSPKIGDKLGEAENFMGNASKDLRGQRVSKAISNQDEALKALQEAKEQAQDMLQQMRLSARGNGSPVPMMLGQRYGQGIIGTDNRYVEIPAVDESQIGKEFKQRILEAMKGGSPEGYIELNKKYYDRIIK